MTDSTRFAKVLKTPEVIALAFGAMIGWSWVLLTGVWLTAAGTVGTLIAFCVGGVAVTLIGLTYSELASAMPKAGGEHIYTKRALGSRWSFVCTWALLFSYRKLHLGGVGTFLGLTLDSNLTCAFYMSVASLLAPDISISRVLFDTPRSHWLGLRVRGGSQVHL